MGYVFLSLKQLSASTCFETIVFSQNQACTEVWIDTKEWVQVEENLTKIM